MTDTTQPQTISEQVRRRTAALANTLGLWLHRAGFHPNWVTTLGFLVVAAGALLVAGGHLVLGGSVVAMGTLFDALDGAVARARGEHNPFGAVLDSTLDRYADGFIFCSLGYYFASLDQFNLMIAALLALVGSFNVSYLRARAANPDVDILVKVGWFSRLERLVVVVLALWLHPWLLAPGVWLLALGANVTALQRLWYTRKHIED